MDESLNIELGRFFATSCYVDTFKKTSWSGKRDVEIFKKCLYGKKIIKTQISKENYFEKKTDSQMPLLGSVTSKILYF